MHYESSWAQSVQIVRVGELMTKITGTILMLLGTAGFAFAGVTTVPEIDPAMGIGALTLLSGALLVIRGRRKRQK